MANDLGSVLRIAWTSDKSDELGGFASAGVVVPVYTDASRTHLVCELCFEAEDPKLRILNSTAVFLAN